MARSRKSKVHEDVDLDEVDAFDANKEKILLNEAGDYRPRNGEYEDESSEEEVMELGEESEGSDSEGALEGNEDESLDEEEEEEDEEKGWGGRQNYYGGDDASDDEDGRQMTEEAIKQQKKHLSELAMDDYVDDDMMNDWQKVTEDFENKDDKKFQLVINEGGSDALDNLDDKEKLKLLNTSFPEFVPLLKELNLLKPRLAKYQKQERNQLIELKIVALSAYLSAITSYFAIFVDNLKSGETFATMKDSPVMESILQSREVWRQASELPDTPANEKTLNDVNEAYDSIDEDEISDDDEDNFVDAIGDNEELQDENEDSEEESEEDEDEDKEFDIDINSKRNLKLPSKKKAVVNDFTEVATPEEVDMEEKQRRKRTLRFYTSKIDQAAAKNNRERLTGDLDLPYKERLFERQQRLIEEARKRGLGEDKDQLGDDLDNEEVGSDDEQLVNEINDIKDSGDDYYQSMKQSKIQKQESRRKAHEAAVQAAKEGKLEELQERLGDDGKRAVNFQILKNKGLTPHRKKDNRNSRVKKRKKYEKAQKKLKSVRQVYDSSNKGPYQGEKTGIKKGLSRSVKLV
ncbi:uncharacterized protein AC631_01168 [Debaryomyces fabryi]|uniref:Sas10 C-terminal domain-containing protein n=1 Tax=Debaryomyces fabryi TaxID=58627 RepID=A0A0V1Q3V0_9ASCO|nr:uncharacterized protein AC631_01168 [Debaryomyces fabryi]KSA03034.1 hypothetical protein AC631_01168 [Debaryomyces fabryi]CUM49207.1 unnamed protein product [Debaryomyces fabryi]